VACPGFDPERKNKNAARSTKLLAAFSEAGAAVMRQPGAGSIVRQ
jgi:hypothetical protein